jgi:hypothetical protein
MRELNQTTVLIGDRDDEQMIWMIKDFARYTAALNQTPMPRPAKTRAFFICAKSRTCDRLDQRQ